MNKDTISKYILGVVGDPPIEAIPVDALVETRRVTGWEVHVIDPPHGEWRRIGLT